MKEMYVRNKISKLGLYSAIGLGTLAVIVALSSAAYADLDNKDNKDKSLSGPVILFDPFNLRPFTPVEQSGSGTTVASGGIKQSPPWIPYRPSLRSPYRPPWWVPGPPPWPPGQPPGPPGPPQ